METLLWLLREAARLLGREKPAEPSRPLGGGATAADLHVFTTYWNEDKIDWALDLIEARLRDSRPLSEAHRDYTRTFLFNVRTAYPRFTERVGRVGESLTRPKEGGGT